MEFLIEKPAFLKILQRVQGIVEKRNTMPILSNVSLSAKEGAVEFLATDLEVFIKDSVEADVKQSGTVTVNARKLFEIVKELPEIGISFKADQNCKVTVKSGKSKFNILGLPTKDFPVFPVVDETKLEKIDNEKLKEMIDKTSFAVSLDETRYNINGFLFEKEDKNTRMVTTDGHRLAFVEEQNDLGIGTQEKNSVLLPRKGMMEIRRLLEEECENGFFIGITEKSASVKKDSTVINIRLLEGEFPDYKKVIPEGNDKEIFIEKDHLLAALKRVSILSSDKIKGVNFKFASGALTLIATSPDIGDATEELEVEYSGEEIEIAFNARYMIDMLEAIVEEKIKILLKNPLSPGLVKSEPASNYTYIVMPMRL
jgi:DNA polymerase-3 subunit beta